MNVFVCKIDNRVKLVRFQIKTRMLCMCVCVCGVNDCGFLFKLHKSVVGWNVYCYVDLKNSIDFSFIKHTWSIIFGIRTGVASGWTCTVCTVWIFWNRKASKHLIKHITKFCDPIIELIVFEKAPTLFFIIIRMRHAKSIVRFMHLALVTQNVIFAEAQNAKRRMTKITDKT